MPNVQRMMLKLFGYLPGGVLVKMAGGKPISIRGRTLDPMMQMLWVEGKKQAPISEMPVDQGRALTDGAAALLAGPIPDAIAIEDRTIAGPGGPLSTRVYRPRNAATPLPVVLFFHQGGFVIGGLDMCHTFCALLANDANCIVVNVGYRLAPEHPFPAPVDDAMAAYEWAIRDAGAIGGDRRRVSVCGDSAGGMLSAIVCQEAKRRGWQMPAGQILLYPWLVPHSGLPSYTDFADAYPLTASLMHWFSSLYFTDENQKTSPLANPAEQPDLTGLPPALIAAAGFDPLSDEAGAYAERLKASGVKVRYTCFEHLPHSFCMMGLIPSALAAQREIAAQTRELIHE